MEFLNVFVRNQFVGRLGWDGYKLSFTYDKEYLNNESALPVSVSLPLSHKCDENAVQSFFDGLLPDENLRKRLANYIHISEENTFGLLKEMGAECAGAISVLPAGETPNAPHKPVFEELSEDRAYELLSNLRRIPLGVDFSGNFRVSGSGAQDKVMAHIDGNKVSLPIKGTPSTHIIKPQIEDFPNSQFNEFFCMKLAQKMGLNAAEVSLLKIKDKTFFATKRYDRIKDVKGNIIRLHQEDFCQALGFSPKIKYENEGGPSIQDCFNCVKKYSDRTGHDSLAFLEAILFNFFVGNGDAHGKNFSLLYENDKIILAPLYDIMSSIAMRDFARKEKMAMRIDKEYLFEHIFIKKFENLAKSMDLKADIFKDIISKRFLNITQKSRELAEELNKNPQTASPIYEKIIKVIQNNFEQLS